MIKKANLENFVFRMRTVDLFPRLQRPRRPNSAPTPHTNKPPKSNPKPSLKLLPVMLTHAPLKKLIKN